MYQFYTDYLDNLAMLHTDMLKAVRHLPAEALDWVPYPGGNSMSVLVVHSAGAEKFWIGDIVAGEATGRDRPAEFKVKGLSPQELEARLNESLGYAELIMKNLEMDDLEALRKDPRNDQEITTASALAHTLKHTALHLGHIELTREIWLQNHP